MGRVTVNSTSLLATAPTAAARSGAASAHPLAQAHQAAVDLAQSQEGRCSRDTNRPRLYLQSSVFARGSGANADGLLDGGGNGLWLEGVRTGRQAFQVVVPNLIEFASLRARRASAAASTRAESARYDEAATHRDQRAAGRGSQQSRRGPRGGREHACPTGSRTAKRGAGQGPL